jgi:hypothetical protein
MRYVITCVGARFVGEGAGKQRTKAIRCGPCYYSIVVNAHCVTSMADTDIDAVRKQKNAEVYTYSCYAYYFYAYRFYFINMWHVYEWPKAYTWSGTFILKEGRYTFTLLITAEFDGSWIEIQHPITCGLTEYMLGCAWSELHRLLPFALYSLTLNFSYTETSIDVDMRQYFVELCCYITYCVSEHQCLVPVTLDRSVY